MIETIQLTADAYYYLLNGEEPLDPDNLEEAEDIQSMFPPAFEFIGTPEPIQGTDMVETRISVAERKKLPETSIVDFFIRPNKKARMVLSDLNTKRTQLDEERNLEPIGDSYWAEYKYIESSRTRRLLPVCKISDYEKWFGKS